VTITAQGFGIDIPAFASVSVTCGKKYCGGTFLGTLTPETPDAEE
jgi:hypothetical protein